MSLPWLYRIVKDIITDILRISYNNIELIVNLVI